MTPFRILAALALSPASLAAQRMEPALLARPVAERSFVVGRVVAGATHAARPADEKASPSLVVIQALGATAAGIYGGSVVYRAVRDPAKDRVKGDAGYNAAGNTGFALGSAAGAALGGYLIGRLDGSNGSLLATTLGATLPALPLLAAHDDPYTFALTALVMLPAEGICATIGYQMTREP